MLPKENLGNFHAVPKRVQKYQYYLLHTHHRMVVWFWGMTRNKFGVYPWLSAEADSPESLNRMGLCHP
jgi:hypothetical protein